MEPQKSKKITVILTGVDVAIFEKVAHYYNPLPYRREVRLTTHAALIRYLLKQEYNRIKDLPDDLPSLDNPL